MVFIDNDHGKARARADALANTLAGDWSRVFASAPSLFLYGLQPTSLRLQSKEIPILLVRAQQPTLLLHGGTCPTSDNRTP